MEWYKSVLDNINSGFVKITNKKITFCNKCALDMSYKAGSIEEVPQCNNKIFKMFCMIQENAFITKYKNAIINKEE